LYLPMVRKRPDKIRDLLNEFKGQGYEVQLY
jgi:hypothetical protein